MCREKVGRNQVSPGTGSDLTLQGDKTAAHGSHWGQLISPTTSLAHCLKLYQWNFLYWEDGKCSFHSGL